MQGFLCRSDPSWPPPMPPHLPSLARPQEISQAGSALPSGRDALSYCWTGGWPVTGVCSGGNECAHSEPLGDCTAQSSDHWTSRQYLWKQPEALSPPHKVVPTEPWNWLCLIQPLGGKHLLPFYRWNLQRLWGYLSRVTQLDRGHHPAHLPLAPGTLALGPDLDQKLWTQTIKKARIKPERSSAKCTQVKTSILHIFHVISDITWGRRRLSWRGFCICVWFQGHHEGFCLKTSSSSSGV